MQFDKEKIINTFTEITGFKMSNLQQAMLNCVIEWQNQRKSNPIDGQFRAIASPHSYIDSLHSLVLSCGRQMGHTSLLRAIAASHPETLLVFSTKMRRKCFLNKHECSTNLESLDKSLNECDFWFTGKILLMDSMDCNFPKLFENLCEYIDGVIWLG